MGRSLIRFALLLAALLALSAAREVAAQEPSLPAEIVDVEWQLVALQRTPTDVENTTGTGITLTFGPDGVVGGSGGCNVYSGQYSVGPSQALTISQVTSTLRACEGPVGDLEQEYFAALQRVARYSLEPSGTLLLTLDDGVGRLSFVTAAAPPPAEDGERQCFSETGKCISGRFLEFWSENGGLPVFGLPLTDELSEGGRPVQYFERQRFERHQENAAPYDVLLGRLGDDLLRRQGIDWTTLPKASDPAGPACRSFPETGHAVCDQAGGPGFLSYWQANGLEFDGQAGKSYAESLALFGLPLSEPMELELEGRPVRVQWFERARFEWHQENPAAYRVLLGRLGAEWLAGPAPAEVALTQDDSGRDVTLAVGQQLVITLPSNPSTGYSWRVQELDSAVLQQNGEPEYRAPAEPRPGAGGETIFRFTAVAAGSTPLTLIYVGPSDPAGAQPAETFAITVLVR